MLREETVATDALLQRIRGLAPTLTAAGDRIEAERRLPSDVLDAMHDAGAFRISVPREYGGPGLDAVTCAHLVEDLAAADASAGWCTMVSWQISATMGAFLPAQGAQEVFGLPRAVLCGVSRPLGKATRVDGGYRVTGRWPFASGSTHATWFVGECRILRDGEPEKDPGGHPVSLMCVFSRDQVALTDTWHVSGLRGTGSNDFAVEDAFVPLARSCRLGAEMPTLPQYAVLPLILLGHGSHALGVARAALDAVRELAGAKGGIASAGRKYREQSRFQGEFALAHSLWEAARDHFYARATEFQDRIRRTGGCTPEDEARVRLANNLAVHQSLQAFELLHKAVGTSALFTGNPLERRFRDLHAASAHLAVSVPIQEAAGRALLGLEPNYP